MHQNLQVVADVVNQPVFNYMTDTFTIDWNNSQQVTGTAGSSTIIGTQYSSNIGGGYTNQYSIPPQPQFNGGTSGGTQNIFGQWTWNGFQWIWTSFPIYQTYTQTNTTFTTGSSFQWNIVDELTWSNGL